MHIYFSGIGGTGIGPLALIAKQAGFDVSGSDKQNSSYIAYLKSHGIVTITIGQTEGAIATAHARNPIDWFVYSSALPKENPQHPELLFVQKHGIKHSKRDEFLNYFLTQKKLNLIAIAGTHGKSTTTAMMIWAFKELGIPLSYSVGAKLSFGDMGRYDRFSKYFVYECDEFDRNFLAFHPYMSLITGVAWDHHEIYPTQEAYYNAFKEFMGQTAHNIVWQNEVTNLQLIPGPDDVTLADNDPRQQHLHLAGLVNRQNAWQVMAAMHTLTQTPADRLLAIMNRFPGLSRRMELIAPNLYSDYAHTPEKIKGAMGIASEIAQKSGQKLVVIYEPLTNRRMHYMRDQHRDIFAGASELYWVPSYLAREDPKQPVLSPKELIQSLSPKLQTLAHPMQLNDEFKHAIRTHLEKGDMVVAMSGGGGNSLDEWLRREFKN
jgi:UDP-N-acetylmuramate--alanine ligase